MIIIDTNRNTYKVNPVRSIYNNSSGEFEALYNMYPLHKESANKRKYQATDYYDGYNNYFDSYNNYGNDSCYI